MKSQMLSGCAAIVAAGALATYFASDTNAERSSTNTDAPLAGDGGGGIAGGPLIGPDVIVGSMNGVTRWAGDGTKTAYSFGTTSCNIGDADLSWDDGGSSTAYPVIGQNMYTLTADGRFEQIGQSWLKHAFCALQNPNICPVGGDVCIPTDNPSPGCGCCDALGVGCSDPYGAGLNGSQGGLGPKWQVNAHTGVFANPADDPPIVDDFSRRVQVFNDDLDPATNPGALFFVEGQYVTADDALWGNQNNNASYRQVAVGAAPTYNLTFVGGSGTQQTKAGIYAWQDFDPDGDVTIVEAQVPGEGLFILGYKVIDEGDGVWRYEYALYNMNSDRSARGFQVPVGDNVQIDDLGFRDVPYHSGDGPIEDGNENENYDGTDWAAAEGANTVGWSTESYEQNVAANALRWGTMYNFRFRANTPPMPRDVEVDLFKPGTPDSIIIPAVGPSPGEAPACEGDLNDDGEVGVADLMEVIFAWGTKTPEADLNGDGEVGVPDLMVVLFNWGLCEG